jgi:hypothetical protein
MFSPYKFVHYTPNIGGKVWRRRGGIANCEAEGVKICFV